MNQLNVHLQHSIFTLATNGWSARKIARELGIDRETVGRHLRQNRQATGVQNQPLCPPGLVISARQNRPIRPPGLVISAKQKPPLCPPGLRPAHQPVRASRRSHRRGLLAGLSAQRIYQVLVGGHAFSGSYDAVKRFVRRLAARTEPPFRRMESAPGQELPSSAPSKRWKTSTGTSTPPSSAPRSSNLAAGGYLREGEDVLFIGAPGVGKTHLAQALGYEGDMHGGWTTNLNNSLAKAHPVSRFWQHEGGG